MKVSSLNVAIKGEENIERVLKCSEQLFKYILTKAQTSNTLSIMNNCLLVYLGLIKVRLHMMYTGRLYFHRDIIYLFSPLCFLPYRIVFGKIQKKKE